MLNSPSSNPLPAGEGNDRVGLIAGNGQLPALFAEAAKMRGLSVVAVAHRGETDRSLEAVVDSLTWVRVGQIDRMVQAFRHAKVRRAVMAGGIDRARALAEIRPDWGALRVALRLRRFGDDAILRALAGYFEASGISIHSVTEFLGDARAPNGHLAGPPLTPAQRNDVEVGMEAARRLGELDIGQTVVVKGGHVLALEAVEGTDETIRRAARLGGPGTVVVKLCKPGQDERFDLPTVGTTTLAVMGESQATVLVVEANRTLLLDAPRLFAEANRRGISVVGCEVPGLRPGPPPQTGEGYR